MKKELIFAPVLVFVAVALFLLRFTGIILMKVHGVAALGIIHKASAILFVVGIIALLVTKIFAKKKA